MTSDLLPLSPLVLAFIGVAVALAVTPGPGVLYIVTRSATQGKAAGLASVAGVAIGNALSAVAASFGLGALIAASAELFTILKVAGALYLFYLAVRALIATQAAGTASIAPARSWRVLVDGALVAALNPKTALFYAALLPQFIDSMAAATHQALALSAIFVGIAAASDCIYALLAGALVGPLLRRGTGRPLFRFVPAAIYALLGILAITSNHKSNTSARTP